jgi:hypothetical protein
MALLVMQKAPVGWIGITLQNATQFQSFGQYDSEEMLFKMPSWCTLAKQKMLE